MYDNTVCFLWYNGFLLCLRTLWGPGWWTFIRGSNVHLTDERRSYQNLQQFLQVTGDEGVVFVKGPAALLGIVAVAGQVAEDHLQPLLVVTHLTLRQRCAQILRRRQVLWLRVQQPEKPVATKKPVASNTHRGSYLKSNREVAYFWTSNVVTH